MDMIVTHRHAEGWDSAGASRDRDAATIGPGSVLSAGEPHDDRNGSEQDLEVEPR